MWHREWNNAFETREPEAVADVLERILRAVNASSDASEKAYNLLAASSCYAILGNRDEVRRSLDLARHLAPANDAIFRMHADFQESVWDAENGDADGALAKLDTLLTGFADVINQPQFRYLYEKIQFSRGVALVESHRFVEARPVLEEARSFDLPDGDRSIVFFHLGVCCLTSDEDESALNCFLEAKKIGLGIGWQGGWHYYVGRVYYRLKNYAAAKHEFLQSENLLKSGFRGPATSDLYKLLAYSCLGLNQAGEAQMYFTLAKPA